METNPTPSSTTSPRPHVVLVPGFWLGAWAWDDVLPHLRARGLEPVALTLPGLEPDDDEAVRAAVTLEDHVRAVEEAITAAPDGAVTILVAHSGAAVPATAALDRHVEQVGHVVWVDTAPVVDGFALDPEASGAEHPLSAQWDDELEQGSMAGLDEQQLATFRERALPQPGAALREAVRLTDERRLEVPMTLVATAFSGADYRSYAEQGMPFLAGLLEYRRLDVVDLPTGHWPMWSRPSELAQTIADRALGHAANSSRPDPRRTHDG
ncbi:alpha/beta fold hydrolase [Ornithinimicrobium pratense]|uniref:Alpha/beta hydrolase n=1 Tax=Ornithinimicrobium pratense TaxID=2593973 RepID=A0A5J6V8A7_9MICO|nr:alpha/beta fold hydrolase [Ornithinimicrobium pratense]QFG69356.1 alpha/beta hydrolase [Ornithinimicrobium pratense]